MPEEMASRLLGVRKLFPKFPSSLESFNSSSERFRILHSINANTTSPPRTLFILDSSFNPPSLAHLSLAKSAIENHAPSDEPPFRFLLLFSTHNADKTPNPETFAHRIALMTALAEDLSDALEQRKPVTSSALQTSRRVPVDIGVTKEPYYTDKSTAIATAEPNPYPSNPTHVHLVGYDTLIRFCNPKYYPQHDPPLSALAPFFNAGHKLRVTQRPADDSDEASRAFGDVEEQKAYLKRLKDGELEGHGFEKKWADSIDMVDAGDGIGISSTRVRDAAKRGEWDIVKELSPPRVSAWVQEHGLYVEDGQGQKL